MPDPTTCRLTRAHMSILTETGVHQVTGLELPHTGLALTPSHGERRYHYAIVEPWSLTHLSTGRVLFTSAKRLSYDTARRLIYALAALRIDWREERPTGAPEVMAEAKRLVREAKEGA